MAKVSVIMAARGEKHLARMVDHLFERLAGDFEIIVVQDGPPYQDIHPRRHLTIENRRHAGLKPSINHAATMATGEYLLKLDAHCAVSPGIDEELQRHYEPHSMLVPRFHTMDEATWGPNYAKPYNDYWNVSCPLTDKRGYRFQASGYWFERTRERAHITPTDETMTHHGSCWFTSRGFFLEDLRGMQSEGYGVNYMEPADLGFRTWLGPWEGRVLTVKTAWYAHLHQPHTARGYPIDWPEVKRSDLWTAEHWMMNQWPQAVRPLSWLIERFWPVPTWPDNWQDLQAEYERKRSG